MLAWGNWTDLVHSREQLNIITFNAAVRVCKEVWAWQWAFEAMPVVTRGSVEHHTITYSAGVRACAKLGAWARVMGVLPAVWPSSSSRGSSSASGSSSGGSSGCTRCRHTTTYNAAVSPCAQLGVWFRAVPFFAALAGVVVPWGTTAYIAAVTLQAALCGAGCVVARLLATLADAVPVLAAVLVGCWLGMLSLIMQPLVLGSAAYALRA